jgi:hypothetical protein
MLKNASPALAFGLKSLTLLAVCSLALQAAAPNGWLVAGNKPTEYESGIDALATYNGHPSAYLKAKTPNIEGFGTLMQDFRADHYVGKRVRFGAFVRTEHAQDWAGLKSPPRMPWPATRTRLGQCSVV